MPATYPFQVECPYRLGDDGIVFLGDTEVGDDHDDYCTLRVSFDVTDFYPAEPGVGAGSDWNGDIDAIEMREHGAGSRFRRFKTLAGDEFAAAKAFLLRVHGTDLWNAGGEFAESGYYEQAA